MAPGIDEPMWSLQPVDRTGLSKQSHEPGAACPIPPPMYRTGLSKQSRRCIPPPMYRTGLSKQSLGAGSERCIVCGHWLVWALRVHAKGVALCAQGSVHRPWGKVHLPGGFDCDGVVSKSSWFVAESLASVMIHLYSTSASAGSFDVVA